MSELKITIDQLKNYLGTGLKFLRPDSKHSIDEMQGLEEEETFILFKKPCYSTYGRIENNKPICYRLSDLDKFIPELGFVPIEKINILSLGSLPRSYSFKWLYFQQIDQLFQWNFWPFGDEYFDKGLVIDKLKTT